MSLPQFFCLIRQHLVLFLSATTLGMLSGLVLAVTSPSEYTATGAAVVTPAVAQGSDATQYALYIQNQMQSYRQLAGTLSILAPAAARLQLNDSPPDLMNRVRVKVPPGTSILEISGRGANADEAAALATEVSTELARAIVRLSPKASNRPLTHVTILQAPRDFVTEARASKKLYAATGLALGLLIAAVVSLARESIPGNRGVLTKWKEKRG